LLKVILDTREKEIAKLQENKVTLQEDLNKALENQNKLKAEFDAHEESLRSQLTQKESEISSLNAVKGSLGGEVTDLNNKFNNLQGAHAALETQLAQIQEERSRLDAQLNSLKAELGNQEAVNETLNKNLGDLNQKLDGLSNKHLALQSEHIQAQQEKLSLEEESNKLKDELGKQRIAHETLQKKIDKLTELINAKEEERLKLVKEIEQLGLAKTNNVETGKLQDELSSLKSNLSKINSEKEAALVSLEEKERNVRNLKAALDNMELEMLMLYEDMASGKIYHAKTNAQLAQAQSLNKSLKKKLKSIYIEIELLRAEKKSTGRKKSAKE
ncbi:MAG: hypothetical protein Q8R31_06635, partial [Candidatus Omnitrophota bacterium]|nr:hypothetical protein [Candidatus Omnitrophota bacterium]